MRQIGLFKCLLSFTTLAHVYFVQSAGVVNAQYYYDNATTNSMDKVSVPKCPYTWQFFNTSSEKCECGSHIHRAILCNNTTNNVRLLDCYCLTLNTDTGQFEAGKCFIGCDHTAVMHAPSHQDHIYNPIPRDPSRLNEWICESLNMNGTMCGNCLPGYRRRVYSYDLSCHRCSDSSHLQNIARFMAAAFGPLTVFYVLVVVFKISATSPKLSAYVIFSQWIAEPLSVRVVLRAIQEYPKIDILGRLLTAAYGVWNLDFFRTLYEPICLDIPMLLTLALDYTAAIYSLLLIILTYLLIELHSRNFRIVVCLWKHAEHILSFFEKNWNMRASMVNVFSTFFLLSYVKLLSVSFTLLIPTTLYDIHGHKIGLFLYYDASIRYFGREHLPYGITAILVLFLFVIFPTLFLTLYPFKWFQCCLNICRIKNAAIHTFADCYLGWFKDGTQPGTRDRRFVVSMYLGMRIFMYTFYAFALNLYTYAFATIAMLAFSIIISLLQPYKEQWAIYNVIDPAMISMLALWYGTVLCLNIAQEKAFEFIYFSATLSFIVALIPLVCMMFVVVSWFFKHSKAIARGLKMLRAKICGRCNNEYEILDSGDHATTPHRMDHPEDYRGNVQTSDLANMIQP